MAIDKNLKFGIHWFRRDLRIAGNPALKRNFAENQGRVLGFFCFDPIFLAREDFSPNRFGFFLETLTKLKEELQELGGDLYVLDEGPLKAFTEILSVLKNQQLKPSLITFNRDYEPFALKRDAELRRFFEKVQEIKVETQPDHLLIEPHELVRDDKHNSMYRVFSPFKRKWLEIFKSPEIQKRIKFQDAGLKYLNQIRGEARKEEEKCVFKIKWDEVIPIDLLKKDLLKRYRLDNIKNINIVLPQAGSLAGFEHANSFKKIISKYGEARDIPSIRGTSQMSIFLKNGSFTTAQLIALLKPPEDSKYLSELIWREFYYHILFHFPQVETESFNEKYRKIKWENNQKFFDAWKVGKTGYPIVDAGMRQLNTTGWMHNRVRMITASFLTKDLLIDYRWGERYFMQMLLDGDLAPNNGGWQWAASTGCDPQPYFRIFNPTLQGQKFDPQGDYVQKYIPELRNFDIKYIHEPWKNPQGFGDYCKPIVDHKVQREKALKLFMSTQDL
jgi:deoxyribodipyrimidine photo-lyase